MVITWLLYTNLWNKTQCAGFFTRFCFLRDRKKVNINILFQKACLGWRLSPIIGRWGIGIKTFHQNICRSLMQVRVNIHHTLNHWQLQMLCDVILCQKLCFWLDRYINHKPYNVERKPCLVDSEKHIWSLLFIWIFARVIHKFRLTQMYLQYEFIFCQWKLFNYYIHFLFSQKKYCRIIVSCSKDFWVLISSIGHLLVALW